MMRRKTALIALAAAALAPAALAKPPAKAAPAPKPAAARPHVVPAGGFDTGNPANLVSLLEAAGAKAQIGKRDADAVLVSVTSPAANFSAQFAQCDAVGKGCKAVLFDTQSEGSPSMVQLNGYNQASALCRGYMDKAGKAHVTMSLLLYPDDTRAHAVTALAAWQGCIGDFTNFSKNPVAYLAAAP
ncbi:MAG TPA: hypothetical protein VLI41_15540 [Phenylobacterium sp.]|uniref:hypothetical protein n=1 Tax=Phenylobacterium sp. TaxID=1871053 RepID=UPI002CD3120E|nr:hypothetical protein [Phenylobacterium sp.]HSV04608.1 hypothetical protein [Phenylobacterium sp.]